MRSPGRAHPPHNPWCPPALSGLTATERGVSVPTRPGKHHGEGSPLRLLPMVPWAPQQARTPALHATGTPQGLGSGGEAERRLHLRHVPPPPFGARDANTCMCIQAHKNAQK